MQPEQPTKRSDAWKPLENKKLEEIRQSFSQIFPVAEFGDLAEKISAHWIDRLNALWQTKAVEIKDKDTRYNPSDPLSRVRQHTVLIAYADSVRADGEKTLSTLESFLKRFFPALRGLHMLPACTVAENRFNDGFFSQVLRHRIHETFGSDRQFAEMMQRYFSMADFVLNHVDIENPVFQSYLNGNETSGRCFHVFSESEYQRRRKRGDFEAIFRPRPFPLFTIFRRNPVDPQFSGRTFLEKADELNRRFRRSGLGDLPTEVIGVLSIFNKIKNDQMLLDPDYRHLVEFRDHLRKTSAVDPDAVFSVSQTQETRHPPYTFSVGIEHPSQLLEAAGLRPEPSRNYAQIYEKYSPIIFGEEIRALTTFSHVQVDLNTSTFEGLKMLIDDFAWYLALDLNMLRLDAANYAFKKWKTSCFGLSQVKLLMKILYLSMDCVSPRIVANLEVNDTFGSILGQMADKKAPPPMMYDFHLAGVLPAVFNTGDTRILKRIFDVLAGYDIPGHCIRFSLAESHDGKSVRGSLDLLSCEERQGLIDVVCANGGKVKYKTVPKGRCAPDEFRGICTEAGLDPVSAGHALFGASGGGDAVLLLRDRIRDETDAARALGADTDRLFENAALKHLFAKLFHGKEPYELCASTRDALPRLNDPQQEADRYMAFYTLAFALMGRNVKSVYFNDLLGLPNDIDRFQKTGEFRDLKRTRSDAGDLAQRIKDSATFEGMIAGAMNHLIALVDSDPALHFRGKEAECLRTSESTSPTPLAAVHNTCDGRHTLVVVNAGAASAALAVDSRDCGMHPAPAVYENIGNRWVPLNPDGMLRLSVRPHGRLWLTGERIDIPRQLLRRQ